MPVYAGAFNDYIRRQLKYESDLDYKVLSESVGPWDFGRNGFGYLNVTGDLRSAMLDNPNLKVLVCSGYEDLATPFLASKYTFDQLDLTDRLQANVTQTFYHSGIAGAIEGKCSGIHRGSDKAGGLNRQWIAQPSQ